jgi:hypothetical protein
VDDALLVEKTKKRSIHTISRRRKVKKQILKVEKTKLKIHTKVIFAHLVVLY